ncbi:molybdopterin-binding protein [Sulfurospirillum arcachonense]|uniref:molybdopterin-binding protein n=1 Tax=Sulfurospirillum arcachonense TaxID=57666 RepID=UPI00046AF0A1|nr:molybdopterin-binding protein [Sulfurospirillum arcachonense]
MISYKNALEIIANEISTASETKNLPLLACVKHICAEDLYASSDLPSAPISLRDGIALLGNKSYQVSTGDTLKEGTVAVIPLEEINNSNHVTMKQNIKEVAEDIKKGELLLKKGDYITAYSITSLASQGIKSIKVFKRIKVSILSIGDNLCPIQKDIKEGEVYNSNALSLGARILESGANIHKVWQSKNDKNEILECLQELSEKSDFIVTTGAMSMHDAMSKTLYSDEFKILFHKVQIAPASPTALSIFNETPILHLPGLPLSSLLGFELLGIPTLKIIKNENIQNKKSIFVKNEEEFTCKDNCTSAIPGFFNGITFKSAPSFKAGMLNVLAKCNGYALIKNTNIIEKDAFVEFFAFLKN